MWNKVPIFLLTADTRGLTWTATECWRIKLQESLSAGRSQWNRFCISRGRPIRQKTTVASRYYFCPKGMRFCSVSLPREILAEQQSRFNRGRPDKNVCVCLCRSTVNHHLKNSDYIGIWEGLRYPPKEAEMKRLCSQLFWSFSARYFSHKYFGQDV